MPDRSRLKDMLAQYKQGGVSKQRGKTETAGAFEAEGHIVKCKLSILKKQESALCFYDKEDGKHLITRQ